LFGGLGPTRGLRLVFGNMRGLHADGLLVVPPAPREPVLGLDMPIEDLSLLAELVGGSLIVVQEAEQLGLVGEQHLGACSVHQFRDVLQQVVDALLLEEFEH
jgi:hypothetical protein